MFSVWVHILYLLCSEHGNYMSQTWPHVYTNLRYQWKSSYNADNLYCESIFPLFQHICTLSLNLHPLETMFHDYNSKNEIFALGIRNVQLMGRITLHWPAREECILSLRKKQLSSITPRHRHSGLYRLNGLSTSSHVPCPYWLTAH